MLLAAFISVAALFVLWHILVTEHIPRALEAALRRTNIPFYLDLMHTRSRRKRTRIVRGSRVARREASRQFAKHIFFQTGG